MLESCHCFESLSLYHWEWVARLWLCVGLLCQGAANAHAFEAPFSGSAMHCRLDTCGTAAGTLWGTLAGTC